MSAALLIDVPAQPKPRKPRHARPLPDWIICRDSYEARTQAHWIKYEGGGIIDAETLLTASVPDNELEGAWESDVITIKITDMHYSIGAKHYYGSVELPRIRFTDPTRHGIAVFRSRQPAFLATVEVYRPLSAKDIREDPERYRHYRSGQFYAGHDTAADALRRCRDWIRKYTRGFKVQMDADESYKLK